MKILGIGMSGLLGRNIKLDCDRPSHKEVDITEIIIPKDYDCVVLLAAYTDVAKAETDRWNCFNVNVNGIMNVLEAYPKTPLVYISSEYAKNPVNFYSVTKSLAEQLVTQHTAPYLIIRTLFKPYPWPYEYAFTDQYTLGHYVTEIAPMIDSIIQTWDRKESRMLFTDIGGRKSMFDLAKISKPDVKPNLTTDIKGVRIPKDYA